MKLFELAIGPEDYDRRWVVRLTFLGFGVELGWAIPVGHFICFEWQWPTLDGAGTGWWASWYLSFHRRPFYLDTLRHWWRYTLEDLRNRWAR